MVQVDVVVMARVALQDCTQLQTAIKAKSIKLLSSRCEAFLGWNFLIGRIFKRYNILRLSRVAGFEIDNLNANFFVARLFVQESLYHGFVLGFTIKKNTTSRVLGLDTSVDANACAIGYVVQDWQQFAETRRHGYRNTIDQCGYGILHVFKGGCSTNEKHFV